MATIRDVARRAEVSIATVSRVLNDNPRVQPHLRARVEQAIHELDYQPSLLAQGMNPAAALAFLISGPITTLPAMAAVRGLTTRRVFALYVAFALIGAVVAGYAYSLTMSVV